MPFAAAWVDLEMVMLKESDKDRYRMSLTCGILKNDTNDLFTKQTHRRRKQAMVTKGGEERDNVRV